MHYKTVSCDLSYYGNAHKLLPIKHVSFTFTDEESPQRLGKLPNMIQLVQTNARI